MIVFFAALLTVFIGMTGLGVDYAFSTLERRTLQNAADAAVLTGAQKLTQGLSPSTDVSTIVGRNATTTSIVCQYVNTSNVDMADCSGSPPTGASGVHVTASHTRNTYFMGVLGIPTVTVAADAIARVMSMQNASTNPSTYTTVPYQNSNALFIVCGFNTRLVSGGTMNILQGSQPGTPPYDLNPAAIDPLHPKEFLVQDPHVSDCGVHDSSFKGLNKTVGAAVSLPRDLQYETGTNAGPTTYAVNGFDGCAAGLSSNGADDCIMILPIATETRYADQYGNPFPDAHGRLHAVRWLPFKIRQIDSNTHAGTLLSSYNLYDPLLLWTYAGGNASGITSVRVVH